MSVTRDESYFVRFLTRGDVMALERAFKRMEPELLRVACAVCRDRHTAEDLVQSTFLAAMEDGGAWDAKQPLLPWLLGILVNRARDGRRKEQRQLDPERALLLEPPDPAWQADLREFDQALRGALAEVPSPYREALEEHLFAGRAPHELAQEQGLAPGTVRMRIHRGLVWLRRKLPEGWRRRGSSRR